MHSVRDPCYHLPKTCHVTEEWVFYGLGISRMYSLLQFHNCLSHCIELCFTLQGLYGSLDQREDLLDELRAAAEPLTSSCDPEVSQKIEAAVQEAVTAWNGTCQSLLELCNRYQDAVRLWKQYREASDAVKAWVDEQLDSVAQFKPEEALRQVKVSLYFLK